MVSPSAKEVFIQGITRDGRTFRPSDWAERLAGVMSSFRPGGAQPGSHLSYSPWCVPTVINGVKCVVVNRELRDAEPMAWDFVHELRQGQRPAGGRGLPAAGRPPKPKPEPTESGRLKKPPEGGFVLCCSAPGSNGGLA